MALRVHFKTVRENGGASACEKNRHTTNTFRFISYELNHTKDNFVENVFYNDGPKESTLHDIRAFLLNTDCIKSFLKRNGPFHCALKSSLVNTFSEAINTVQQLHSSEGLIAMIQKAVSTDDKDELNTGLSCYFVIRDSLLTKDSQEVDFAFEINNPMYQDTDETTKPTQTNSKYAESLSPSSSTSSSTSSTNSTTSVPIITALGLIVLLTLCKHRGGETRDKKMNHLFIPHRNALNCACSAFYSVAVVALRTSVCVVPNCSFSS